MGFTYHHLNDPDVREAMSRLWSAENETLLASGRRSECYGADLIEAGWAAWEDAMPEALAEQDDDWLVEVMLDPTYWRGNRPPSKPGYKPPRVNVKWAANMLCRGEFNIAYIHGLSATLLERGEAECVVYRADSAYVPRGECSEWEGQRFATQAVLDGHRIRYWPPESADPDALSIPSGFNCHHSIRASGAGA